MDGVEFSFETDILFAACTAVWLSYWNYFSVTVKYVIFVIWFIQLCLLRVHVAVSHFTVSHFAVTVTHFADSHYTSPNHYS